MASRATPSTQCAPGAGDQLVLTVRAKRSGPEQIELTCTTMGGSVAATLEWTSDDSSGLLEAIVAAVESSGFDSGGTFASSYRMGRSWP